jgi:hypothetical protein
MDRGVRRGRIWTACELRSVATTLDDRDLDLVRVAEVKLRFDCSVLSLESSGAAQPSPSEATTVVPRADSARQAVLPITMAERRVDD